MKAIISLILLFLLNISYSQNNPDNTQTLEINEMKVKGSSMTFEEYSTQQKDSQERKTRKERKTVFVEATLTPFEGKDIQQESRPLNSFPKNNKEAKNGRETVFVKATLIPFEDKEIQKHSQPRKTSINEEKEEEAKNTRKTVIVEATLTPTED